MGNAQPHNKTGKKVVEQKLENAKKTGVLSLSEHKLEVCPNQVYALSKLTTLDLSMNKIAILDPKLANLKVLKSLNVDNNKLTSGSMNVLSSLSKLKNLSANNNMLGRQGHNNTSKNISAKNKTTNIKAEEALPAALPSGLKTLLLSNNSLSYVPRSILGAANTTAHLRFLEKLDLSSNNLATLPDSISNLPALNDLNLDDNAIVSLPKTIGKLSKLKVLSLRNNHITVASGNKNQQQQPLPKELWVDTLLIDMNLHGNPMTSTQLNTMEGYDVFLSRRRDVKNKDILGGAMTDLEGCGLK